MIAAVSSDKSSYPGGKSGAGIYQRLINLIPPHRVLVVPFAGHCGVVRNIRPAEQTIVIDQDPAVCQWWDDWSRSKQGRRLEIHHCDGIEWLTPDPAPVDRAAAAASSGGRQWRPNAIAYRRNPRRRPVTRSRATLQEASIDHRVNRRRSTSCFVIRPM
jgi:hypothetical protein